MSTILHGIVAYVIKYNIFRKWVQTSFAILHLHLNKSEDYTRAKASKNNIFRYEENLG